MLDGTDLNAARKIRKNYNQRLRYCQTKIRQQIRHSNTCDCGCRKTSLKNHSKLLQLMGDKCVALRAIGFRETDENEDFPNNTLVPITQEWIDEQLAKETPLDKLAKKARQTQSHEDVAAYITALSQTL